MRLATLVLLAALSATSAHALTLTQPGARLSNTTVQGDLNIEGAHDAKIHDVTVTGLLSVQHSDRVKLERVTVLGPTWNVNNFTLSGSVSDTFMYCRAPNLRLDSGGTHPKIYWNCDRTVEVGNQYDITMGPAITDCGPAWFFDDRNRYDSLNVTRIHLKNATCYAVWRWRADVSRQIGCYNNRFADCSVIVDGGAGKLLPTSSGTCDGSNAGCWGLWNSKFIRCTFDAMAAAGPVDFYFQGGAHGLTFDHCTIKVPGKIEMFDVHGVSFTDCTLGRDLLVQQEYGRPLPKAGDLVMCRTTVSGATTIGASYQAIPGFVVTACSTAPPSPTPADTARFTIKANPPITFTLSTVPAVITVVKP